MNKLQAVLVAVVAFALVPPFIIGLVAYTNWLAAVLGVNLK